MTVLDDLDVIGRIAAKCAVDRQFFVSEVLGVERIEPWQAEVMSALDEGETRVSIRSGNGVGKTALCAWLALHFLLFRNDVKIPVTAPSSSQMRDGLIPEITRWRMVLPDFLRSTLEATEDRVRKISPGGGETDFISFRTARADAPEALAGIHATHVMGIVDEASGVPDVVYEFAEGLLSTPGAIMVLIGNPTRAKGYFWRTHTALSHAWRTWKVPCQASSRVSPDFIRSIAETYGEHSNVYRYKVLAEFPDSLENTVIPAELVRSAVGRDIASDPPQAARVWGIDPGRGGDPTGFVARSPHAVEDIEEWYDADLMATVGRALAKWEALPQDRRPEAIHIDSIGLGAGVADRLRELGLPVVDVNVAEAPALKARFPRLRAEIWYAARDWFETRAVSLPKGHPLVGRLVEELTDPLEVITSAGKQDVESKTAMRNRGLRSPNLADALCLTFAFSGAVAAGRPAFGSSHRRHWSKPLVWTPPGVY